MSNQGRPLSPHLSVYRWPITMTLSILHRATGAALSAGFVVLVCWLLAAANGAESYEKLVSLLSTPFGKMLLVGWSFAFFYHLANGVRHLVWDMGRGLEKEQATRSAWVVLAVSALLTASYWLL